MSIKRDLEFLYEIGCLRFLQRTWKQFLNPDAQNISEHTFKVIWIALILAKYEKTASEDKIIKMALIHDLPESRTGDVHYVSRLYTERKEGEAIRDIFINTSFADEFVKIWREYEERKCPEAKIVKDADTLDVELELNEQEARGHKLKDIWFKKRGKIVFKKLFTKAARKFWQEIKRSNPHDWHLKGNNRFNSGDWREKK